MCFNVLYRIAVPGWRPVCARLSCGVLRTVRCGALTSLSPWCHPASVGLRHHWPLPKSHSATSAIHKRQALLLSFSHPPSSSSSSPTYLLILVFPTERHLNYTPAQSLFYIQLKHSAVQLLSLPPLQSIFFYTPFLPFQWKNLSPIMSSVGSGCVWWQ